MHHASDKEAGGGACCASHIALITNAESPAAAHGNREKTEQPKVVLLSLWSPCESYARQAKGNIAGKIMDPSRVNTCVSEVQKISSIVRCKVGSSQTVSRASRGGQLTVLSSSRAIHAI
jgi:hypothetical protein